MSLPEIGSARPSLSTFRASASSLSEKSVVAPPPRRWSLRRGVIPHNAFARLAWDQFMGLLILYTVIALPLEVAFDPLPSDVSLGVDVFVTAGFAANIYLCFRTSFETPTETVEDLALIRAEYLRKWFWLDLVATVPWDLLFNPLLGDGSAGLTAFRMLRLFRLARLLAGTRFSLIYSQAMLRLLRLITAAVCASHWLGCAWYWISDREGFSGVGIVADEELAARPLGFRYYRSLWLGVWALLSIGSELNPPETRLQITFCLVVMISGIVVFASVIGSVEVLANQTSAASIHFREKVQGVKDFCRHHRLPRSLERRVLRHYHHLFRTQGGLDDGKILRALPREVQATVKRSIYKEALTGCSFFAHCEDAMIDELCSLVRPEVALRGDVVIRQGAIGEEMFIVQRGRLEAVDLVSGERHSVIEAGRFFGEISLLSDSRRSISVRALCKTELLVLYKDQFLALLRRFPAEERRFLEVAEQRLRTTERIAAELEEKMGAAAAAGGTGGAAGAAGPGDAAATACTAAAGGGGALPTPPGWDANALEELLEDPLYREVFQSDDVRQFMAAFDTNGDGVIDAEEQRHVLNYMRAKGQLLRRVKRQAAAGGRRSEGDDDVRPLRERLRRSVTNIVLPFYQRERSLSGSALMSPGPEAAAAPSSAPAARPEARGAGGGGSDSGDDTAGPAPATWL